MLNFFVVAIRTLRFDQNSSVVVMEWWMFDLLLRFLTASELPREKKSARETKPKFTVYSPLKLVQPQFHKINSLRFFLISFFSFDICLFPSLFRLNKGHFFGIYRQLSFSSALLKSLALPQPC